eukprot:Mrub_04012.p1 GENE.Mrub_04012~~Mrub_04012.p1  ORF type:complete len:235 (+),score=11.49 Mrub_04012:284-988(+)
MPKIHSNMNLKDLSDKISGTPAYIPEGNNCIDNSEPLVSLSVLPDSEQPSKYAVVFALSHVIADGYTYYKLLQMLNYDEIPIELQVTRKHNFTPIKNSAIGKEESNFTTSSTYITNAVLKLIFSGKPDVYCFYIDSKKINEHKQVKDKDIYFLSTNDILNSTFGNLTNTRVNQIPYNCRDKFKYLADSDAGNYQGSILFTYQDLENPSMVDVQYRMGLLRKERQTLPYLVVVKP